MMGRSMRSVLTIVAVIGIAASLAFCESDLFSLADSYNYRKMAEAINAGADVNKRGTNGQHLLLYLFTKGSYSTFDHAKDVIPLLIQKTADIDLKDADGNSALMHAVKVFNTPGNRMTFDPVIDALIARGASLTLRNKKGYACLELAVASMNHRVAMQCRKNGQSISPALKDARILSLFNAALVDDLKTLSTITKTEVNQTYFDIKFTPIFYAAAAGNTNALDLLIAKGAYVKQSTMDGTPLLYAMEHYHEDCAKILIAKGASPNEREFVGLRPLFYCQNPAMVKYLIAKGADPNIQEGNGNTPVVYSIVSDFFFNRYLIRRPELSVRLAIIEALVEGKARLTNVYFHNKTVYANRNIDLLMLAAMSDEPVIAKYLVGKGFRVNTKDAEGKTAFDHAVFYAGWDLVEYFLSLGAVYDTQMSFARAVTRYTNRDTAAIAKFFLEKGASTEKPYQTYETLTWYVTQTGKPELLALFMDHGANINHVNRYGYSILDILANNARTDDQKKVVAMLRARGATNTVKWLRSNPVRSKR